MTRKIMTRAMLLMLTIFTLWSCSGSGNMLTQYRNTGDFSSVDVTDIQHLVIRQGEGFEVKVTADDNVINSVKTFVEMGTLNIYVGKPLHHADITVELQMPQLRMLSSEGKVRSVVVDEFCTSDFDLVVGEGSRMLLENMAVDGGFNIYAKGNNFVKVGGRASHMNIKMEGNSRLNGSGISCDTITMRMMEGGRAIIKSNGSLAVSVNGNGKVYYMGEPKSLNSRVVGEGSILKYESSDNEL